jgi:hypothetical protein
MSERVSEEQLQAWERYYGEIKPTPEVQDLISDLRSARARVQALEGERERWREMLASLCYQREWGSRESLEKAWREADAMLDAEEEATHGQG